MLYASRGVAATSMIQRRLPGILSPFWRTWLTLADVNWAVILSLIATTVSAVTLYRTARVVDALLLKTLDFESGVGRPLLPPDSDEAAGPVLFTHQVVVVNTGTRDGMDVSGTLHAFARKPGTASWPSVARVQVMSPALIEPGKMAHFRIDVPQKFFNTLVLQGAWELKSALLILAIDSSGKEHETFVDLAGVKKDSTTNPALVMYDSLPVKEYQLVH
jgi:hypothetical protein